MEVFFRGQPVTWMKEWLSEMGGCTDTLQAVKIVQQRCDLHVRLLEAFPTISGGSKFADVLKILLSCTLYVQRLNPGRFHPVLNGPWEIERVPSAFGNGT